MGLRDGATLALSGVSIVVSLLTAVFTLIETRRTRAADQRPWIGAPDIVSDGPITSLVFRNVGKSATTGLFIDAKLIDAEDWRPEAERCYSEGKRASATDPALFKTYSIIPGGSYVTASLPSLQLSGSEHAVMKNPRIVGCVVYKSDFDKILHSTKFFAIIDQHSQPLRALVVYGSEPK